MALDLVQRLKTCSAQERKAAAMELSQAGTDESVHGLIEMADGDVRVYTPRSWKTLWLKSAVYYSLDDQLAGIEALGQTGNRKALDYLKNLAEETQYEDSCGTGMMQGSDFYPDYWFTHYDYPNAKGWLASCMSIDGPTYGINGPDKGYDEKLRELKEENICHKTLNDAIHKLETALQQNSSPDNSGIEQQELSPSGLASIYLGPDSSYMDEHGQTR
jgi:hypothetical protein